jgi:WD40 repeat protein
MVVKETIMTNHTPKPSPLKFQKLRKLTLSALALSEILAAGNTATGQGPQPAKTASFGAATSDKSRQPQAPSQAYVDFLLALKLADDGSKPEALQRLAESLRLQPRDNPAAGLAFELLTEQRTNSSLLLRGHTAAVLYAAYSSDGNKIITTSADNTARLWDAHTGKQLTAPLQHDDAVRTADFSPDGRRVVTGTVEGAVQVWDVETGHRIGAPMETTGAAQSVKFSPDGKIIAIGSDAGRASIRNAGTGESLSPPIVYHEAVNTVSFSPDGSQILTATGDGVADLLSSKNGSHLIKPLRQNNIIFTAVYSSDGNTVLTASADHTARTWNAKTGEPLGPVFHHGSSIEYAAFNQDASRVVTASMDHTARVWDAKTGNPITPPLQHGEAILKAAFSPDGNFVATASRDQTARLWDATSGELLRLPVRTKDQVTTVTFNPGGSSLLVASGDSSVQVFDMPPREAPPTWVADLAEFAATQIKYNQDQQPDLTRIRLLRTELLASKSNDPWAAFGRWYFSESAVRPISPWSTVSLQQYVDALIALGDKGSLDYAASLSHDQPAWMVKIVPLRNKLVSTATDKAAKPQKPSSLH